MREREEKVRQAMSKQERKYEHIKKVRNQEELLMTKGKLVSLTSTFDVKIQFSIQAEQISPQVFIC